MTETSLINTSLTKELFDDPMQNSPYQNRKTWWDRSASSSILGNLMSNNKSSRKSRWEPVNEKVFTPLPVTSIPENLDVDTFENLLRKQRLEDLNRRIAMNEWEDNDTDLRSPSPEPIYDSKTGNRLNTRLVINKEKYIKEKTAIIGELIQYDKNYQPPSDYKRPKKVKILYIKGNEKHNFTRLIIGPKGDTQKKLEEMSHCKISIRGKGSNWNTNSYEKSYLDEMEPLHVYIQADNDEDLKKGEEIIKPLLDETSEEFKKHKMAVANVLGYNTEHACEFCGERGHKSWACPMNIGQFTKVEVKCRYCNDKGHPSCDCPMKPIETLDSKKEMENELDELFREIDEFKEKNSVPILEPEITPGHIRRSVLVTGKITTVPKQSSDDDVIIKEVKENNNSIDENNNQPDVNMIDLTFQQSDVLPQLQSQTQSQLQSLTQTQTPIHPLPQSHPILPINAIRPPFNRQPIIPNSGHIPPMIPPMNLPNGSNTFMNHMPMPMNNYSLYVNNYNNNNLKQHPHLHLQQGIPQKSNMEFNIPFQPIANNPNIKKSNPIPYNYVNMMNSHQHIPPINLPLPINPITGMPEQMFPPQQNVFPFNHHHNRNYYNSAFQGKIPPSYGLSKSFYHSTYHKNLSLNNFSPSQVNLSYGVIPIKKKENEIKETMNVENNNNNNGHASSIDNDDIQIEKIE